MLKCQKDLLNQIQYGINKNSTILNIDLFCKENNKLGQIGIDINNPSYYLGDLLDSICKDCQFQFVHRPL